MSCLIYCDLYLILSRVGEIKGVAKGKETMVWLMVFSVYAAPANAVNWDGPWRLGMSRAAEQTFTSEADCRNYAIQFIARMHQGMLAPMRSKCVSVDATLPKGAVR
jgi:hypothetical protein